MGIIYRFIMKDLSMPVTIIVGLQEAVDKNAEQLAKENLTDNQFKNCIGAAVTASGNYTLHTWKNGMVV